MSTRGWNIVLVMTTLMLGSVSLHLSIRLDQMRAQAELTANRGNRVAPDDPVESKTLGKLRQVLVVDEKPHRLNPRASGVIWKDLASPDLNTYVHRLRDSGCPEPSVRDIITGEVNRQFAAQRALLTTPAGPKFWQTTPELAPAERRALEGQLQILEQDRNETLRALLGVDPAIEQRKSREGITYSDNRLGNLTPEQQDQVSLVREQFNESWRQVQATSAGAPASSPEILAAQLQSLDEERLGRLAKILSPDELAEHELQTSWTALQLRERLRQFSVTDLSLAVGSAVFVPW